MMCERAQFLLSAVGFLLFSHNMCSLSRIYSPSQISPTSLSRCLFAALPVDGSVRRGASVLHGASARSVSSQWLHLHLETHLSHLQR